MRLKQIILKALYPLVMRLSKASGRGVTLKNDQKALPNESFFALQTTLNNGQMLALSQFKDKKVLLVNTASNCGYTGQYEELQQLYQQFNEKVVIIGFPANDFKEQEKSGDGEIAQFCQLNYGVTFPLARKSQVIKGEDQNPIYRWLTQQEQNGWNSHQPDWNFSKYLVNEKGVLTHYFGPAISPLSTELVNALQS